MRPAWCAFLLLMAGAIPALSQETCPELKALREALMGHGTLEQARQSEALAQSSMPSVTDKCAPVVQAHRWVSHARAADFEWNPATKLRLLNTGLDSLNALVDRHPDMDILRALRLTITGTAPRFLGVDDEWEGDRNATRRLLAADHWAESPKFSAWMEDLLEQTN